MSQNSGVERFVIRAEALGSALQVCAGFASESYAEEIKKITQLLIIACADTATELLISLSDGKTNPASPLTDWKGKRDAPLNPAPALESDLHSHPSGLRAPASAATGAGFLPSLRQGQYRCKEQSFFGFGRSWV